MEYAPRLLMGSFVAAGCGATMLSPPRRPVLWWLGGQRIEAPGCGRQNLTVQFCYSHRLLQPPPFPPTSSIFKPRLQ